MPLHDMSAKRRPSASAMLAASDDLPTPGGPAKQRTGPRASRFRRRTARYSRMRSFASRNPKCRASRTLRARSRSTVSALPPVQGRSARHRRYSIVFASIFSERRSSSGCNCARTALGMPHVSNLPRSLATGSFNEGRGRLVSQPHRGAALLEEPEQRVRPAHRQRHRLVGEQNRIRKLERRQRRHVHRLVAEVAERVHDVALFVEVRVGEKTRRVLPSVGQAAPGPAQQMSWLKKDESLICILASPSSPTAERSGQERRSDQVGHAPALAASGTSRRHGGAEMQPPPGSRMQQKLSTCGRWYRAIDSRNFGSSRQMEDLVPGASPARVAPVAGADVNLVPRHRRHCTVDTHAGVGRELPRIGVDQTAARRALAAGRRRRRVVRNMGRMRLAAPPSEHDFVGSRRAGCHRTGNVEFQGDRSQAAVRYRVSRRLYALASTARAGCRAAIAQLALDRRHVAGRERTVARVEPACPLEGGEVDYLGGAPWRSAFDRTGLARAPTATRPARISERSSLDQQARCTSPPAPQGEPRNERPGALGRSTLAASSRPRDARPPVRTCVRSPVAEESRLHHWSSPPHVPWPHAIPAPRDGRGPRRIPPVERRHVTSRSRRQSVCSLLVLPAARYCRLDLRQRPVVLLLIRSAVRSACSAVVAGRATPPRANLDESHRASRRFGMRGGTRCWSSSRAAVRGCWRTLRRAGSTIR